MVTCVADPLCLPGSSPAEPFIEETLAASLTREVSIPLFFHRMASTPPRMASREARCLFADETLLPPTTSIAEELNWMARAGASAICQEGGTGDFARAAVDTGVQLITMVNMSPLWLAKWDTKPGDIPGITRYIRGELDIANRWPDTIRRHQGRPVLWVFSSIDVPADVFVQIRKELHGTGHDPFMLFQTQLAGRQRNAEVIEPYLRAFDGVFIWGGGLDSTRKMLEMITPVRKKIQEQSGVRKHLVITAKSGHWRVEKGSMVRRKGTQEFRRMMEMAYQSDADAVNIESWNDYSENHHVQVSMMNSTVFADLCRFYGERGAGESFHAEDPGIYISHRQEILQGEILSVEVLHLPIKGTAIRELSLLLSSSDGRERFRSRTWKVADAAAKAFTINVPTAAYHGIRTLVPTIIVDGNPRQTGTSCTLRNGRILRPFSVHMSLANKLDVTTMEFTIDARQPGSTVRSEGARTARIHVESKKPIQRLEILKNGMPVYSAAHDDHIRALTGGRDYKTVAFFWDAPSRHPGESLDFSGTIRVTDGQIMEAYLIRQVQNVKTNTTEAAWRIPPQGRGLHNGIKLVFVGNGTTRLDLTMPAQRAPISLRWAEIEAETCLDYPLQPHARLRIRHVSEPAGYPIPLNRKTDRRTVVLPALDDLPENTYILRVTGPGARITRSLPVYVQRQSDNDAAALPIWDEAAGHVINASLVADHLAPSHWTFDTGDNWVEPDATGWALPCDLGGAYRRDGRFDPDARPSRVNGRIGRALRFDGNDVCHIPPRAIPRGCWYIDMWVKPEVETGTRQTLFFNGLPAHLAIEPDGRLWMRYGDNDVSVRLRGRTALAPGKWHRVTFLHDLQKAKLFLNTRLEAQADLIGLRDHIAYYSTLGAILPSTHTAGPGECFRGIIDDVRIGPRISDLGSWVGVED